MSFFGHRIAIDLGTAYSVIADASKKSLERISSSVACRKESHDPVAFGELAREMCGKNPERFDVLRPLTDGVVANDRLTQKYLEFLIKNYCNSLSLHREVHLCVPWGATDVELASYFKLLESFRTKIRLVREPFAAAIGAGKNIFSSEGVTIIDSGGGTTEISTMAGGVLVACHSLRMGGNKLDERIQQYFLTERHFEIGLLTAEKVKRDYICVHGLQSDSTFEVEGICRIAQAPKKLLCSLSEVSEILENPLKEIEAQIFEHIQSLPSDLKQTIREKGLTMVGGGSQLKGWQQRLTEKLGIPVNKSDQPEFAVIRGMMTILNDPDRYEGVLKISETI